MRSFILVLIVVIFIISAGLNCMLYGSIARAPYFGITITEYAEKERDIFLHLYIAGGTLLPRNEKLTDISLSLVRRSYKEAFKDAPQHPEPISPYATGKTFDLPAVIIRILYWVTPATLALLFIVIFIPHQPRSKEEDL